MKKTPLNQWHRARGANMAVFGGYEMPLWYPSGVKSEHCAVITHAGLFDTSHMAVILVSGTGAYALLQQCFTRDLNACVGKDASPLFAGRCVYGIFLDAEGNTIDDAIVYRLSDDRFMIVVNAGMGATIAAHLRTYTGDMKTDITDMTDRVGKCDLQGPLAAKILSKVLAAPDAIFNQMPYFSFKGYFGLREYSVPLRVNFDEKTLNSSKFVSQINDKFSDIKHFRLVHKNIKLPRASIEKFKREVIILPKNAKIGKMYE